MHFKRDWNSVCKCYVFVYSEFKNSIIWGRNSCFCVFSSPSGFKVPSGSYHLLFATFNYSRVLNTIYKILTLITLTEGVYVCKYVDGMCGMQESMYILYVS